MENQDDNTLDAKYAEELLLQDAILASLINPNSDGDDDDFSPSENSSKRQKLSIETGEPSSQFMCEICAENKDNDQTFIVQRCNHRFCKECISKHISVKLQKTPISNGIRFPCPGLDCEGVLDIETSKEIVAKDVLNMWGDAICESMIDNSERFYCPYKDCSSLLVNDGDEVVRESECPFCRRLFCAQCNVAWHSGVGCEEYMSLNENERRREDLMVHELAKRKKWQRCPRCVGISFAMHVEQLGLQLMVVASNQCPRVIGSSYFL
ncbi:hypothetical protein BUALT_Bualt07G0106700 [Buddleja alternifolia]|uniref:RBR-type E3 ubiquitin transferase n=1 Tax=Buddleja alternifolia TaxID=168488 RepID=A0AAV6XE85_9LAMI|nr:hypothetical protein BUALT_Bualt07G0106700 [Buddleja alternifolia]